MDQDRYRINIEEIFEGPMDLLVFLIRKNEVDIYDIPIAMITEQYLEYLDLLQHKNIDVAGDFLVMATTLLQIKSRMLLPTYQDENEELDPRLEIARPLLEYLQMKDVAEQLKDRNLLGQKIFLKPSDESKPVLNDDLKIDLFELVLAFQNLTTNMPENHCVDLSDEQISIKDKISELINILEKKGTITFDELFKIGYNNKNELIITLLAILEMARLCLIRISQQVQSGIIRLFYL